MYDLIILSPIINRSLLHNESLSEILKNMDGLKCKWIIHINKVLDESLVETDKNLRRILKSNNIDLDIKLTEHGGTYMDWYDAVKYLVNEGSRYESKFGIFYLEDDWEPVGEFKLKDDLLEYLKEDTYLGLVQRSPEVSFNPGIWSTDVFKKFLLYKINNPTGSHWNENPNVERLVVYPMSEVTGTIKNVPMLFRFRDIGRSWMKKYNNNQKTISVK